MTTMSIKTFINVAAKLPVETSVLLRGNHGIGKSQVVRQVARGFGLPVIDRRLSQMSEGDMIGLPSTDGEVTRFNPPDWFKTACTKPMCLFLDELNRAPPTSEVQEIEDDRQEREPRDDPNQQVLVLLGHELTRRSGGVWA